MRTDLAQTECRNTVRPVGSNHWSKAFVPLHHYIANKTKNPNKRNKHKKTQQTWADCRVDCRVDVGYRVQLLVKLLKLIVQAPA